MTQPPHTLLAEIATIQKMNVNQILAKYGRFFTGSPTRCTATLRQEAIYRLQEEHYNLRISDATAAVLNASLEKREERRKGRESLLPGTQFVREWHGEKHVLIYRGPKQYEYLGQTDRSPSVVAKRITGTNWNGREFFHLPSLKSMKQED